MKRTHCKGVTMMELLIVLGILALLMALLTPTFFAVRERARLFKCRAHLHQISLAIEAYKRDHHGRLPVWLHELSDYLDSPQVFLCPSDASHPTGSGVDSENRFLPFKDPQMSCSYLYEFNPLPWPAWLKPDFQGQPPNLTWRQVKTMDVKIYGNKVPVVRCLWHYNTLGGHQVLNLAHDGSVYQHKAGVSWTQVNR